MQIAEGSIVCGKSGEPLRVISASEGKVVVKTDSKLIRVDQSLILRVISPPPDKIQVGDYLKRHFKDPVQYPAALLANDSQRSTHGIYPVRKAVVE